MSRAIELSRIRCTWGIVLTMAWASSVSPVPAQKFHPSDPMLVDDDRLIDVREQPEEIDLSDFYDRFGHMFANLGDPEFTEAKNVNSLDELPDSSWFTNRRGAKPMSLAELIQGANFDGPPNVDEEWLVFRGKSQGITPGFQVEDGNGNRWVIKFDPVELPELATAAEVIASKMFYAMGYNVPQNYIVHFQPENLKIKAGTMVEDSFGDKVKLSEFRLRRMLGRIPRGAGGRVRAIASKYIAGVPLGPFRYFNTRSDDPNDVIPHEHRRELRALRLLAAWTNHDDTRAHNTQSAWEEAEGKHFVRYYLLDFGSTFGSGSVMIQRPELGFNYALDFGEIKANAPSFGVRVPKYRKVEWPKFPERSAVGRWESKHFDVAEWRNDYPNPAFVRMTARDAFWAGKIIMSFKDAELLAMVKTGEYSDPENERYFHQVLVERQRESGRFGINGLNPLDHFRLSGRSLEFTNLSEKYGFSDSGSTRYQVSWSLFDNEKQERLYSLRSNETLDQSSTVLPEPERWGHDQNLLLLAEVQSLHPEFPHWKQRIGVYLRYDGSRHEVVGIERESPRAAIP